MSAKKRPESEPGGQLGPTDQLDDVSAARTTEREASGGPQSVQPWGTTGGTEDRDAPWGAAEDSPMDEGSEEAGLPPARRGERRADEESVPWPPESGRHGFGPVEPTRIPEAGPGAAPPDPAPARRPFPDDTALDELRNNPIEEQTGMHSEGVSRRE
ncbi:hypothetical protein [Plantactinospora soyae]|uniref:Uncharacterized protein n=1 Tax=Plantactinospora soyae TaxID=1544732 RepID=A0A927R326_9ACTN|nr:hypothetical protein [Plantactinospora soyae]MBE1491398.1 hypothetical protein [Plantactinospora soyae]